MAKEKSRLSAVQQKYLNLYIEGDITAKEIPITMLDINMATEVLKVNPKAINFFPEEIKKGINAAKIKKTESEIDYEKMMENNLAGKKEAFIDTGKRGRKAIDMDKYN